MIKYKTKSWEDQIEKVEILRESELSVWTKKNRNFNSGHQRKRGPNNNYWDTWQDAHSYLMQKTQLKIDGLRNQLDYEEKRLAKIVEMKG